MGKSILDIAEKRLIELDDTPKEIIQERIQRNTKVENINQILREHIKILLRDFIKIYR